MIKPLSRFALIVLGFAVAGLVTGEVAAGGDAIGIVKAREAKFKEIGGHMKAMADALQSGKSDSATLLPHAQAIAALSQELPGWFPAGSGPAADPDTQALDTIWQKPEDFKAAATAFQQETAKLVTVSVSTDANAIGAELKAVGGTCGGCHKEFRKPQ